MEFQRNFLRVKGILPSTILYQEYVAALTNNEKEPVRKFQTICFCVKKSLLGKNSFYSSYTSKAYIIVFYHEFFVYMQNCAMDETSSM